LSESDNRFLIKSATTRPRRTEVKNDAEIYDFLNDEEFDRREANGEFFEVVDAHGCRYATQNSELQKIIDHPENLYFKDIDVVGTQKLVKYLKGKAKVLTIFLDVPDDVLYDRLINRGESDERAKIRISRGKMEREYKKLYDLVIDNIDLEKTLEIIKNKLKEEGF
ncbi:MAG: hypothetical protein K2K31_02595, partial [Clostridia bacterium]|nr:hypothetical protein [Clostridia bacterium]